MLNTLQRILVFILALAVIGVTVYVGLQSKTVDKERTPHDKEYLARFQQTQEELKEIVSEQKKLIDIDFEHTKFVILNDNLLNARVDILVSSDDNWLQARGGVAKAILDKAGSEVEAELKRHRKLKMKQGDIAITTGGQFGIRAIIHPAVIDMDESRYPDENLVRKIVRDCLYCAGAFGAKRIAFPVIGGGTASKLLTPWKSIQAMIYEIIDVLQHLKNKDANTLTYIALYVFDNRDITGNLEEFVEEAKKAGISPIA